MKVFSDDIAVEHLRNLRDIARAATEAIEGIATPVATFRRQAAALLADIERATPVARNRKAKRAGRK